MLYACLIQGGSKQANLGTNILPTGNTGEGANTNINDSDGVLNGNNADITVLASDIPSIGANNHSFDFGFKAAPLASEDWGDAPDSGYPALSASNGPRHTLDPALYMGDCVDDETDGQQTATANGDDKATSATTIGTCATDDEDSLTPPGLKDGDVAPTVDVVVVNTTAANATVACWVDYNGNKAFDNATERGSVTINASGTATVTLPNVPATANANASGLTFMRCRIASVAAEVANATGAAANGEVEDYPVTIAAVPSLDWGDAPDSGSSGYPTLSASNGPRHTLNSALYMGSCVDDETDGQQSATANGDDTGAANANTLGTCAADDEDSLTPPSLKDGDVAPTVAVVNTTAANATLACWVDYNGNKTFDNGTERGSVTTNASGTATVTLPDVPATASADTSGSSFMRCRIASVAAEVANATGAAASGEVEDYQLTINANGIVTPPGSGTPGTPGTPVKPIPTLSEWGANHPDHANRIDRFAATRTTS